MTSRVNRNIPARSHCHFLAILLTAIFITSVRAETPAGPEKAGGLHLGVVTCAGNTCHGANAPLKDSRVQQNEFIIWHREDKHAKTYTVLFNDASKRIARNLGIKAAHTEKLCLDCHADNVPAERRGKRFQIDDGVGCEACHGGGEHYLGPHVSGTGTHAENIKLGLYPAEEPKARATLCLSCHLGGGPAGLSAAIRAAETGLSHVLLEAEAHLSNTIHRFQKGKHVMAEPIQLPLRSSLAFEAGSRESLLEAWTGEGARLEVNVRRNSPVTAIGGDQGNFSVELADGGTIRAETVILAIGLQGQPNKRGIDGEALGFVDYRLDDPDDFTNQVIAVIGAGDSAIETALALAGQNRVIIVNRRGGFDRAAGNRNAILDAIAGGGIECFYHGTPRRIEAQNGHARLMLEASGEAVEILCDKIIARLGASHPRAFLESCRIAFSGDEPTALPALDARYQANVQGLYVIGALAGYPLIKQALNQGYEVIEHIRGKPVQSVEDELLLDKFAGVPGLASADEILAKVGGTIALFGTLDARPLRGMLLESRLLFPAPDTPIFSRGDYSDSFYAILGGDLHIELPGDEGALSVQLEAGEFLGDAELISGQRRAVSAVAGKNCMLLETPRLAVNKLAAAHRTVAGMLERTAMERAIRWYLTPGLPEADYKMLESKLSRRRFASGDMLFREGDSGNKRARSLPA
jgi:thioredoxin reductase/CRP-like cAMP-binding protein